jgi:hypothetical protein
VEAAKHDVRNFKQVLDAVASLACVLICVLLAITVINRGRAASAGANQHTVIAGLQVGARFPPIEGLDFKQHDKSILFFVDGDCSHCVRNLPVYQTLVMEAKARAHGTAALLGLFESEASRSKLVSLGFDIPSEANLSFAKYRVAATPTVVVVGRNGIINNFWVGELSDKAVQTLTQILE